MPEGRYESCGSRLIDHISCQLDQLSIPLLEIWSCNAWHLRQSLWEPVGKDKPSQGLSQVKAWAYSLDTDKLICRLENEEWSLCIRRTWCPGRKMELHKQDQSLHTLHPQRARWVEAILTASMAFQFLGPPDILIFLQSPYLFKLDGPAIWQHQSDSTQ